MTNEFPKVFKTSDFVGPFGRETLTPEGAAYLANKSLSEKLVKRFGTIDGYFSSPNCNQAGDTHFILSTEAFPIKREPVKVEVTRKDLAIAFDKVTSYGSYGNIENVFNSICKELGLEELPAKPDSEGR